MIDTSNDVTPGTIKLQKDFVKTLSKQFNIGPGKARVALIVYGSRGEAFVKVNATRTYDAICCSNIGCNVAPCVLVLNAITIIRLIRPTYIVNLA